MIFMQANHRVHKELRSSKILLHFGKGKTSDVMFAAELAEEKRIRYSINNYLYWIAPEIIDGRNFDCKSDVWSFGTLILEIIEGQLPLLSENYNRKAEVIKEDISRIVKKSNLSSKYAKFIEKCLQIDLKDRKSAIELIKDPIFKRVASFEEAAGSFIERIQI